MNFQGSNWTMNKRIYQQNSMHLEKNNELIRAAPEFATSMGENNRTYSIRDALFSHKSKGLLQITVMRFIKRIQPKQCVQKKYKNALSLTWRRLLCTTVVSLSSSHLFFLLGYLFVNLYDHSLHFDLFTDKSSSFLQTSWFLLIIFNIICQDALKRFACGKLNIIF